MEKFVDAKNKARQNIRIADHMLTMTYPMVKDTKILLAVLENIFLALTNSMAAILHYERSHKRIQPFNDNFNSKFSTFRAQVVPHYKIPLSSVRFIAEIKEIVEDHKEAPTTFSRKENFVIADKEYAKIRTLGPKELKTYLKTAKKVSAELLELVK